MSQARIVGKSVRHVMSARCGGKSMYAGMDLAAGAIAKQERLIVSETSNYGAYRMRSLIVTTPGSSLYTNAGTIRRVGRRMFSWHRNAAHIRLRNARNWTEAEDQVRGILALEGVL